MTPGELADALTARLDGPHSDRDTSGAAWLAAEAVRFLNYATGSHAAGLTYPATAYAVVGALESAVSRMPQLLDQVTDFLNRELAAGRLGEDSGLDPVLAAERARRHLQDASASAAALAAALGAAHSGLSGLHQARTGGEDR